MNWNSVFLLFIIDDNDSRNLNWFATDGGIWLELRFLGLLMQQHMEIQEKNESITCFVCNFQSVFFCFSARAIACMVRLDWFYITPHCKSIVNCMKHSRKYICFMPSMSGVLCLLFFKYSCLYKCVVCFFLLLCILAIFFVVFLCVSVLWLIDSQSSPFGWVRIYYAYVRFFFWFLPATNRWSIYCKPWIWAHNSLNSVNFPFFLLLFVFHCLHPSSRSPSHFRSYHSSLAFLAVVFFSSSNQILFHWCLFEPISLSLLSLCVIFIALSTKPIFQ